MSSTPFVVSDIDWNPSHFDVGNVGAVTEDGTDVVVFSDKGALVFSGGAIGAVDPSVVEWRSASVLPAADGNGSWPTAVDASGQVYRLRARSTLENVSDRYGLAAESVRAALPLGDSWVAFILDGSIAVADGKEVVRYDVALTSGASGGAKRVAGVGSDGKVRVLDVAPPKLTTISKPGVTATIVLRDGRVLIAGPQEIDDVRDGVPSLAYRADAANLHGLVLAGDRIWFGEGSRLCTIDGLEIARSDEGLIRPDAKLVPSPSGAVWAISNGELTRLEAPVNGDEEAWDTTVRPIYAQTCSACHRAGGTAGIDLSTYAAWATRRGKVYDRVVVKRDMPQGGGLSDADREAIRVWAMP